MSALRLFLVLGLFGAATLASIGCGAKEPFSLVRATGKVTYEDGSLIPAEALNVIFISQAPPLDLKTCPRPGMATVEKGTGEFKNITTHKANDGLVLGKHKVFLGTPNGPLPPTVVPPEYCDAEKTPLEVDTAQQPFDLKVRKPR